MTSRPERSSRRARVSRCSARCRTLAPLLVELSGCRCQATACPGRADHGDVDVRRHCCCRRLRGLVIRPPNRVGRCGPRDRARRATDPLCSAKTRARAARAAPRPHRLKKHRLHPRPRRAAETTLPPSQRHLGYAVAVVRARRRGAGRRRPCSLPETPCAERSDSRARTQPRPPRLLALAVAVPQHVLPRRRVCVFSACAADGPKNKGELLRAAGRPARRRAAPQRGGAYARNPESHLAHLWSRRPRSARWVQLAEGVDKGARSPAGHAALDILGSARRIRADRRRARAADDAALRARRAARDDPRGTPVTVLDPDGFTWCCFTRRISDSATCAPIIFASVGAG